MKFKHILILLFIAIVAAPAVTGQQTADSSREMTIEESYLLEAMELMIIREAARATSREQKLIALEYIGQAIERGNTGDEIRATVEFLSFEGTLNRATENRRLVNDFPEVRREAARYLGLIGTEEAAAALIRINATESEPMVLQESVKSLGLIESENYDAAIASIVRIVNRFHNSASPDNLLALAAVDALGRISERNGGISDPAAWQLLRAISDGPYVPPVRERARQVFNEVRRPQSRN